MANQTPQLPAMVTTHPSPGSTGSSQASAPHPHFADGDACERHSTRLSTLLRRRKTKNGTVEEGASEKDERDDDDKKTRAASLAARLHIWPLPAHVAWFIPPFKSWTKMKPVLRSALIAWIAMFFLVINPVERYLGNASFLVLVFALLQPAELPLTGILERELFMLLFGVISWAWTCVAIKISYAARKNKVPASQANLRSIFMGEYIEAAPSIVCCLFLAAGSPVWLYLKVRFGPSPFVFSAIIAALALDIFLTDIPLFPYPNYLVGKAVLLPMAIKSAVTLIVSVVFFPKSVNSLFVDRIVLVLKPLSAAIRAQEEMFKSSPLDPEFDFLRVRTTIGQSERAIPLVAAATRLLSREISFGLASGEDLRTVERHVRALVAPANGWAQYFALLQRDLRIGHFTSDAPAQEKSKSATHTAPHTAPPSRPPSRPPSPSAPGTPRHSHSRPPSRPGTPRLETSTEQGTPHPSRPSSIYRHGHHHHHHDRGGRVAALLAKAPIYSHLQQRHSYQGSGSGPDTPSSAARLRGGFFSGHHTPDRQPVGVWESLRFSEIDQRLHTKSADFITDQVFGLLGESSEKIMEANAAALDYIVEWLATLNKQRYALLLARFTGKRVEAGTKEGKTRKPTLEVIAELEAALDAFKTKERLQVIDLFKPSVEQPGGSKTLPHRYLFQAFVHQHTNIVFTDRLLVLLRYLEQLERERSRGRIWWPSWPRFLTRQAWANGLGKDKSRGGAADARDRTSRDDVYHDDDHHPENDWYQSGLGGASPRDPDCLEPTSGMQRLGTSIHRWLGRATSGNMLFALKVGVLTGLVSMPFFFKRSAGWVQKEKGLWTLFMAQVTFGRHRGDSISQLVARIVSTVAGAIVVLLIWYISSGSGRPSPYAMMVVWGIAVVPIFVFRLYWPFSPQTSLITALTIAVTLGYSWKDSRNPAPYTSPGYGWEVAWRRLLEVVLGATAAVIWSFVPPSSTLRQYLRESHAAAIHRAGALHCRYLAFTLDHEGEDPAKLSADLVSLRVKLRTLDARKAQVAYETALRGPWPRERYEQLFEIQLALSKLLTAAVIVSQQLGPSYSKALLRRTKFARQAFMADVLAIYSICSTALRTAQPLPQNSPVLFSRYLSNAGFLFGDESDDEESEAEEDGEEVEGKEGGMPKRLTVEVLESQEYLSFAVGVITLSGIVMLLDRLILATKQLVGESFELPPELFHEKKRRKERKTRGRERRKEEASKGPHGDEHLERGDEREEQIFSGTAEQGGSRDEKRQDGPGPAVAPRGEEAA